MTRMKIFIYFALSETFPFSLPDAQIKPENAAEKDDVIEKPEEKKTTERPSYSSSSSFPVGIPSSPSYPTIPYPTPRILGFPDIGTFIRNFEKSVNWTSKSNEAASKDIEDDSSRAKRDAEASAEPSHLGQVLPPPPGAHLPLFPPLDKPLHAGDLHHPTPSPHGGHHVTISTPTHHISHGVLDHGSHHAVHKELHQVHGHEALVHPVVPHKVPHHPPAVVSHELPHHHAAAPVHHAAPVTHSHGLPLSDHAAHHHHGGYPKPPHGGTLEDIFGVKSKYSAPPEPHYEVVVHSPPAPKLVYEEPAPAYHAPEPAYHAPEPAYHAPEPAYHAPEPAYHAPEPAYHAPEPAYHAPEPAYHAPEPAYHAPEPAYHAPEPAYHAPEPAYHAPEPAYHAPEPAYHAPTPHHPPVYKPDFHHPTGDYVSSPMVGHPFSLEHVFHLSMPKYYEKKYPHMAHMLHDHAAHHGHHAAVHHEPHHDHHHAAPTPAYHPPPKKYDHPVSGYEKPKHGATLEEIFGVKTKYHTPKPAYHPPVHMTKLIPPALSYDTPKPAYHAPEPVYKEPVPAYHAPEPAYHAPKPAYKEPTPAYHAPKPAYKEPTPAYHAPKPTHGYAPPHNGGSLEEIFGLKPHHAPLSDVYVTPRPDYHPTTYKPKMPEYVHKDYKSLPDPGYVMHYLPYENYQPVHPESLARPPPVPHHPGAAHILVPGAHPLPAIHAPPAHPDVRSLADHHHLPHHGAKRVKRSPPSPGMLATTTTTTTTPIRLLPGLVNTLGMLTTNDNKSNTNDSNLDKKDVNAAVVPDILDTTNDIIDSAESRLVTINSTLLVKYCPHQNNFKSAWEPCLPRAPAGGSTSISNNLVEDVSRTPDLFKNLPLVNFDVQHHPAILKLLNISNISSLAFAPHNDIPITTTPAPLQYFTTLASSSETSTSKSTFKQPGSVPTTPSWKFPSQGTTQPTQASPFQPSTAVYFDQEGVATTTASKPLLTSPLKSSTSSSSSFSIKSSLDSNQSPQTNFQMLTNALADFSPTNLDSDIVSNFVNTNSLVGSGQTVAAFQDRRGFGGGLSGNNGRQNSAAKNDILAAAKADLIDRIKEKETELEKKRLFHQIKLKETELQRLLSGLTADEVKAVPSKGRWRIQSQLLGGKPVPKGEWILTDAVSRK